MRCGKSQALLLAGFSALLTLPGAASAQELGARNLARGGTGLADSEDAAGLPDNIAALALTERYDTFIGAGLGPHDALLLRGGAVDTRTAPVALGLGYTRLTDDAPPTGPDLPGWVPVGEEIDNPVTRHAVYGGLAYPMFTRRLSIGVLARYDWRSAELTGDEAAFNFGVSVAGRPIDTLTIALLAKDLLENDYPEHERRMELDVRWAPGPYLGVGAGAAAELFEGVALADAFDYRFGADVFPLQWLAVRGGFRTIDDAEFLSGGIGFVSERAALDYGIRGQLDGDEPRLWHALDARVHF